MAETNLNDTKKIRRKWETQEIFKPTPFNISESIDTRSSTPEMEEVVISDRKIGPGRIVKNPLAEMLLRS